MRSTQESSLGDPACALPEASASSGDPACAPPEAPSDIWSVRKISFLLPSPPKLHKITLAYGAFGPLITQTGPQSRHGANTVAPFPLYGTALSSVRTECHIPVVTKR